MMKDVIPRLALIKRILMCTGGGGGDTRLLL